MVGRVASGTCRAGKGVLWASSIMYHPNEVDTASYKAPNRPRRWYTIQKLCRQVYERSEVVLAVASCIVQCL